MGYSVETMKYLLLTYAVYPCAEGKTSSTSNRSIPKYCSLHAALIMPCIPDHLLPYPLQQGITYLPGRVYLNLEMQFSDTLE